MRTVAKNYLVKYSHKNDVEKQVNQVLNLYNGLSASLEKFYFSDGTSKDLICLKGTIPIKFKGAQYNIPISLHIPELFPNNPPIVYVTPTSTMAVKPSSVVDTNGLVRVPYITSWRGRTHSLAQMIQILIQEFGNSPPVFSKPAAQARPPRPNPPQQYPGYPPPPRPYNANPYGPNAYGQSNPPYPVGGMDPSRPPNMQPPAYPPPYSGPQRQPSPAPAAGGGSNLPYPAMNPPGYYPGPGAQNPTTTPQPPVSHASQNSGFGGSGGGMDPIKASLLTAITENLSRRIQNAQEMAQKDLDALTNVQVKLKSNRDHLEMTVGQLEQQIAVANSHVDLLQQKKQELETAIEQVHMKSEVSDIDDCITPSCPLYKQLLNLYAEECAIEDTTYYLGKALMDSVVDLETYLKNVRALSRKQFMVRAQMQKARQVAGLKNITPH